MLEDNKYLGGKRKAGYREFRVQVEGTGCTEKMTFEEFPEEVMEGHPMYIWGINVSGSGNSPGKGEVRMCLLFTKLCKETQ